MRGLQKLVLSANKTAIQNGMLIGGQRLCLILSDFCLKGKKFNLIRIIHYSKSFHFSIRISLVMVLTCKERQNLSMNRASLYRESLDRVS